MPASNISRIPTQPPTNVQDWSKNNKTFDKTAIHTPLRSTKLYDFLSNDQPQHVYLKLPFRENSSNSALAMLFNTKDRKPNILSEKMMKPFDLTSSSVLPGPCGDGSFVHYPTPTPPTLSDRRFDLNTFSSEDYSFETNPNDMNSIISSDWGDEACVSVFSILLNIHFISTTSLYSLNYFRKLIDSVHSMYSNCLTLSIICFSNQDA